MVLRKWGAIPRVRILPHLSNFNDGPVLAEIKGELSNYYVSIEFDKNGKIWFKSGQATDKSSAWNIIKQKITEGSARRLTHNTQGRTGRDASAIHINTVAEKLKSVNNENRQTFNQRTWHGSGMDFSEFNLEKALTGAGDMVHGWGIYTAKNKKTARAYKKHAKSKGLPSYQYEVDIPFIDVRPCVWYTQVTGCVGSSVRRSDTSTGCLRGTLRLSGF